MRSPPLPPQIREQSAGAMRLLVSGGELTACLTADAYRIAKLPRVCPIQTRLAVWELERAIIPILLVRVVPDSALLFESWMDAISQPGVACLKALSKGSTVILRLLADGAERALRAPNPHQAKAAALVRRLEHWQRWSGEQVEAAAREIRRLYPTTRDIWFAAAEH